MNGGVALDEKRMRFQKLTPINAELDTYEEALDFAFSEPDVLNIALTGPYGAGKSSVWKAYEKKKMIVSSTIHISLTDFNDTNINEETKDQISGPDLNKIEFQILNQMLYQIDNKAIPDSKYSVKKKKCKRTRFRILCLLTSFVLGGLLLLLRDDVMSILPSNISMWLPLLIIVLLAIPSILAVGNYLCKQRKGVALKRISIFNSKVDLAEDDSDSLFDKELDEIVYIIRESGLATIVFEDLDRFDNTEIFSKLRAINYLVNRERRRKIRFIYMLRDDMFLSKDRTKFFDFILPIVPVIDSSNAKGLFLEIFKEVLDKEHSLDKKLIERISIYVDDMRLLKNIYNEYIVYFDRIKAEQRKLDPNKLLGIITFKNVFPFGYEEMQQDKGYIYRLFSSFKKQVSLIINEKDEEITLLKNEVSRLEKMIEDDYPSLIAVYFPTDRLYDEAGTHDTLKDFAKHLIENPAKSYVYRNSGGSGRESGENILAKILKNPEFVEKSKLIRNDKSKSLAIKRCRKKIQELSDETKLVESMTLSELLEIGRLEHTIFEETKGQIKENHYFPLVKFLVVNGYIDETYKEYLSYFYPSSITENDQRFLRSILEGAWLEYNYELDDPQEVLCNLEASDFMKRGSLNFFLLRSLVDNKKDGFLKQMLETIEKNNLVEFLDQYMSASSETEKSALINRQAIVDKLSLEMWFSEEVNLNNRYFTINTILSMSDKELAEVNKTLYLREYLNTDSVILNYLTNDNIESAVEGMMQLDIKFSNLEASDPEYQVLKMVEEKSFYTLTRSNINFIINGLLYSHKENIASITRKQLTLINTEPRLSNMKLYIEEYYEIYLENYINGLEEDVRLTNTEEETISILDADIESSIKEKFILHNETKITDITDVESREIWGLLLKRELILGSYHNAREYNFGKDMVDDVLLGFINGFNDDVIEEWAANVGEDFEMEIVLLNTKGVNINIIEELVKVVQWQILEIAVDLSWDHVAALVRNDQISMNIDNLASFNAHYNNLMCAFVAENVDGFLETIIQNKKEGTKEDFLSKELIYELLNYNGINDEDKKKILNIFTGKLKLSKLEPASVEIKKEVANTKFDITDLNNLICKYESSDIQDVILEQSVYHFAQINSDTMPIVFISHMIERSYLDFGKKVTLINVGIRNGAPVDQIKQWVGEVEELQVFLEIFEGKRPIIGDNSPQYLIAKDLEKRNFISLKKSDKGWRPYLLKRNLTAS